MTDRSRRILASLLIVLASAIGVLVATPAGASTSAGAAAAGTARPANLAVATALAKATIKKLDAQYLLTLKADAGSAAPRTSALTQLKTANWSGYVDTGGPYSYVSGQWTEPSLTCNGSATQETGLWVGLNGYSNSTIEQAGTLLECLSGTAYQFTWYAMYPTTYVVVGSTVAPGDTITALVSTVYGLTVGDSPNYSNGFVTPLTGCPCGAYTSAEWIAQDPGAGSGNLYPLAQFSPWTVSNAGVKLTSASTDSAPVGISSFPDTQLTMVNGSGAVKAQPGALNSSGNGFTVTWQRSS